MWKGKIYVEHCAVFGLATAGGIQGSVADATVAIFTFLSLDFIIKWVDDFCFFRIPIGSIMGPDGKPEYVYQVNLDTILNASIPLGIPWHPTSVKGQGFAFVFEYFGFAWTLRQFSGAPRRVTLPDKK
jgi:hypothetical protein